MSQSPGPGSEVRSDSFWEKMGTLGRKKKAQEVQQVEVEGKHAIDSPGQSEPKHNIGNSRSNSNYDYNNQECPSHLRFPLRNICLRKMRRGP